MSKYLKAHGEPEKPEDLLRHECICMRFAAHGDPWAWELERGKKDWRVPVRGPIVTNDPALMRSLAVSGVGLLSALESSIADHIEKKRLKIVLEPYAAKVPGFFLYYPSRAQVSPAFKAFIDVISFSQ